VVEDILNEEKYMTNLLAGHVQRKRRDENTSVAIIMGKDFSAIM
jgi:hypothetical protein